MDWAGISPSSVIHLGSTAVSLLQHFYLLLWPLTDLKAHTKTLWLRCAALVRKINRSDGQRGEMGWPSAPCRWGTWLPGIQPVRPPPRCAVPLCWGDLVILTRWDGVTAGPGHPALLPVAGGRQRPLGLPTYTRISGMPCQRCHAPSNSGAQGWGSRVSLLLVDYFCEMLEKANGVPAQLGGESARSCLPPALPWLS